MGMEYTAKCNKCGHEFEVSEGGGFFFHLLHCDKCGKQKSISFDEIGEPHLQYLKGLGAPTVLHQASMINTSVIIILVIRSRRKNIIK